MTESLSSKKKEQLFLIWIKKYWPVIGVFLGGIVFIHFFLLTKAFRGSELNSENAEQFGDFVGGYVGAIFN